MPILSREPHHFPDDPLADSTVAELPWYVAYVRSRQEKCVARYLHERSIPYYLPLRQHRTWQYDRWRTSHLPLFPGYLFFRGSAETRREATRSKLLVATLEVPNQPLLQEELAALWQLQAAGCHLVPHPYLGKGDTVRITQGSFMGYSGTVVRTKGDLRLVVSITLLRRSVAVEISREDLAPAVAEHELRRKAG